MRKARKRPSRSTIALRWAGVAALAIVAFLYYRPLHSYFDTRAALAQRSGEVSRLRGEQADLVRRLDESTSAKALQREARRLGLVRPGERLFIVKGIKPWLRKHGPGRTIGRDG
jgi:hypothetical protein